MKRYCAGTTLAQPTKKAAPKKPVKKAAVKKTVAKAKSPAKAAKKVVAKTSAKKAASKPKSVVTKKVATKKKTAAKAAVKGSAKAGKAKPAAAAVKRNVPRAGNPALPKPPHAPGAKSPDATFDPTPDTHVPMPGQTASYGRRAQTERAAAAKGKRARKNTRRGHTGRNPK